MPSVALILPPREAFSAGGAGAIALVAERLSRVSAWTTVVIGRAVADPCPGLEPVRGGMPYPLGVARLIRRLRPDLVEVHNRPSLARVLSWLHPCVTLVLHNDPVTMRGMRDEAARARTTRRLAGIAAVSGWVASRASPAAALVVPNGIDLAAAASGERTPVVAFAGRLVADKGADVFVAAMASALRDLPGWRAVMVGADRFGPNSPETPFLRALRPQAAAAGVELLGWRPHDQVMATLRQAAIAVVPSRWAEPFGLAALEAMAEGAALIHTGTGGLADVVGGAGVRVPPGDTAALTQAVVALARDPARRRALSEAGRARAECFDIERIAARMDSWRAGCLAASPRHPISRPTVR